MQSRSRLAGAGAGVALLVAVLVAVDTRADVILTGNIVSFFPGTDLRVGQTGSGQMTVNNGSVVTLTAGGNPLEEPYFVMGRLAGSSGAAAITDPGSAVSLVASGLPNTSAAVHIGREGSGTMSITNGGALRVTMDPNALPAPNTLAPNITVGREAAGTGSLTVSNGTVLVEGVGAFFFIGREGGTGTANFGVGSGLTIRNLPGHADGDGAALVVGRNNSSVGLASFTDSNVAIDGGLSAGGISVGRDTGARGTVTFTGLGTLVDITAGSDAFLAAGREAGTQGQVIVSNGARINLTGERGTIDLGRNAGATGSLQIVGGSVIDLSASTLDGDAIVGGSYTGKTSAGSGTLLIDGAGSHLNLGNATGGSPHRVIVGAATTLGGVSSDGGHVTVRNGGLLTADVVNLGVNGVLDGNGKINAAISLKGGVLAPGNSPGKMTVGGDLTVSSGRIEVEIGGIGDGEYDVLDVLGGVVFNGGSILFKFIDGFLPQLGDAIDFLRADTVAGLENAVFAYEGAAGGFLFDVTTLAEGGLRFLARSDAAAVPEPTSLALLGIGLLGFAIGLRRRGGRGVRIPGI